MVAVKTSSSVLEGATGLNITTDAAFDNIPEIKNGKDFGMYLGVSIFEGWSVAGGAGAVSSITKQLVAD